jgi:hypothetical protein
MRRGTVEKIFLRVLASDMVCPSLHQGSALLQEVGPVIGSLSMIADGVRERAFGEVPRIAVFGRPVAK